jgi:hypothetical protein
LRAPLSLQLLALTLRLFPLPFRERNLWSAQCGSSSGKTPMIRGPWANAANFVMPPPDA